MTVALRTCATQAVYFMMALALYGEFEGCKFRTDLESSNAWLSLTVIERAWASRLLSSLQNIVDMIHAASLADFRKYRDMPLFEINNVEITPMSNYIDELIELRTAELSDNYDKFHKLCIGITYDCWYGFTAEERAWVCKWADDFDTVSDLLMATHK